jgi:uncharacterized protein (TIGR03000 family)
LPLHPVPSVTPITARAAAIAVAVPAGAEVWFDDDKTKQTGTERFFQSPPLPPGRDHIYVVRARWTEGGKSFEQMQAVRIQAGNSVSVRFPVARP